MFFLWRDRSALYGLERDYRRFLNQLHEIFPTLSAAEVARLTYKQLENTCVAIEQMGTDLATKLADSFGNVLDAHFAPHAQRIENAVDTLVSATTQEQAEALGKLVDRFFKEANMALGEEFGRLRESMRLAAESQEVFRQSIEGFGDKLAETTAIHAQLLESTARAGRSLVESLDRLEAISASLGSSSGRLEVAAQDIHKAADAAALAYEMASEGQQRLLDGMQSQLALLDEARQALLQSWGDALRQAETTILRIRDITRELETGVAEHLVGALTQFDSALAEALRRFGATLADLQDTVEGLPNLLLKMDETASVIRGEVDVLKEALQRIEHLFSGEMFGNVERAAETASRLESVVRTTETLLEGSRKLQERFAAAVQALSDQHRGAEQVTASLERMETVVKDLNARVVDLNSRLQRLQNHFDGDGSLGHLRQSLETLGRNLNFFAERLAAAQAGGGEQSGGFFGKWFRR
ncbi:MAG: hypothetical protein Kow00109_23550 [Acidobacteriota bacterium]